MDPNSTVSPIEVLWTLVGATACLAHLYLLRNAILDRRYQLRYRVNGGKRKLVRTAMRRQGVSALVQAIFVGIGLYAMTLPPNPSTPTTASAYFTGALILAAELLLVVNSVQDYRDALDLLEWVMEHPPKGTAE